MFFDRLKQLCDDRNISIYKAATAVGLNRAAANKWKGGSIPNGQTVSRLADFFGVTTDYLIGDEKEKAPAETGKGDIDKAKAAFFEGYGDDLSEEEKDELWEDARVYTKFKAQQKKLRKE